MLNKLVIIISLSTIYLNAANIGVIATGEKNGTYIKIGKDISSIFKKYNVELDVERSEGSLDNLRRLVGADKQYESNWAIVQADTLKYYKYKYYKKTKQYINTKVKTILPLYNEALHIFSKKGKTIKFETDTVLTVGVKSKKSGGYVTSKVISNLYGVEFNFIYSDFETAQEYLQKGVIDIFIDVTAKPNKSYKNLHNIDFVVLPKNKMMDRNYQQILFSKEDYPWIEKDSFGYSCPSILITNLVDKKYDKKVNFFIEAILQNSNELKSRGDNKWKEVFEKLKLNHKRFNYHPQVIQSISSYKAE